MRTSFRLIIPAIWLSLLSSHVSSQIRWDSLPADYLREIDVMYSDSNYLYIAGPFNQVGFKYKGIARWNGVKWDSLGAGINGLDSLNNYVNTKAMTRYHNKLYVGGDFWSLGRVIAPYIGIWDGLAWDSMPIQPFKLNSNHAPSSEVSAFAVVNDKLYMGGEFDTVAGFPCKNIASWNGTNWSSLNFPNQNGNFNAICEYQGSIYVGGNFYGVSFPNDSMGILRLDSMGVWHPVGAGLQGGADWIESMAVYQGELYVAGYFHTPEGNYGNNIQRWDGTKWSDVGGGISDEIFNLTVFNNKLYAVGQLTEAGGIPASKIAEWDGTKWCGLGDTFNNTITDAAVYKDSLYAAMPIYNAYYICKWVGGDYVDTCGNDATGVSSITNYGLGITSVMPNPNDGRFTIALCHAELVSASQNTIEIYNVLGERIYNVTLSPQTPVRTGTGGPIGALSEIDISGQPNGVYFYRVISESGELVGDGKVVIQK